MENPVCCQKTLSNFFFYHASLFFNIKKNYKVNERLYIHGSESLIHGLMLNYDKFDQSSEDISLSYFFNQITKKMESKKNDDETVYAQLNASLMK